MKKGFTLVELLAVIVILGIIATIFVPNTIKVLKQNNVKIYKIKESQILKSVEDYVNFDNAFVVPEEPGVTYVSLTDLVSGGYMSSVLDTTSGNTCTGFVKVTNNTVAGYNYDVCLVCDEYHTDKDYCSAESVNEFTSLIINSKGAL